MKHTKKVKNNKKKQNAKLRNNDIFGKLIENPINKIDVKFVNNRRQYLK